VVSQGCAHTREIGLIGALCSDSIRWDPMACAIAARIDAFDGTENCSQVDYYDIAGACYWDCQVVWRMLRMGGERSAVGRLWLVQSRYSSWGV
jgi:hypothetical protein